MKRGLHTGDDCILSEVQNAAQMQNICQLALSAVLDLVGGRLNVAGLGERPLGEHRSEQLVDKYGEENNVADKVALGAKLAGGYCHAQRNTRLRQQGDTKIFAYAGAALGQLCAAQRTGVLADGAEDNVNNTNTNDCKVGKYAQLQLSPSTGKIHTTFNQALTATGRLSSSKPNLQNIPIRTERGKEIRKAFIPSRPDGVIVSADYSQIELRIMAHLSCDSHLIQAFRNGQDVHAITAAKIFGIDLSEVTPDQRRIAKTANFGIMYGISAFGLAQRLKMGRAEAKKIIEDYFANFPAISSYIEDTLTAARETGYVETIFGRRRYLPDINSKNGTVRSLAERNAVNAPIQGTSADIIKLAMINVARRLKKEGMQSRMVLQIHDELVFDAVVSEVNRLEEIVREEMENVMELSVPLTVECNHGNNWLEAH